MLQLELGDNSKQFFKFSKKSSKPIAEGTLGPLINELLSRIEEYQEQQGLILESLKKIEAQAYVALSDDFLNYNSHVIHYYLCALSNNIEITT